MSVGELRVIGVNEQSRVIIDLQRWSDLARGALLAQGIRAGELNLLFVDTVQIQALNCEHMGRDQPTDVLSFPLDGRDADSDDALIGDIVICPEIAAVNAPDHAGQDHHSGTFADEVALLVVHGVLHILGHDHLADAEAEIMEGLEQELLAAHHQ